MKYNIVDILIWETVNDAIQYFGLEGAEEAIKKHYTYIPEVKKKLLEVYYKWLKGE